MNSDDLDLFSLNNVRATVAQLSPSKKMFRPLSTISPSRVNISNNNNSFSSLKRVEGSLSLRESTPSSIHLSEFEQPPKAISTPFHGMSYLDAHSLTVKLSNARSSHFRFQSDDDYDDSASKNILHDTNESIVSSNLTNNSPLYHKTRVNDVNDEISIIVDKMRNSISLGKDISYGNEPTDDLMEDQTQSMANLSAVSMIDVNDLRTSTPQKSILKNNSNRSVQHPSPKKVRIDENVQLIDSVIDKSSTVVNHRKRPISSCSTCSSSTRSTPKKIKLTHKVDPDTSYADLMTLCGSEKDPINLISM